MSAETDEISLCIKLKSLGAVSAFSDGLSTVEQRKKRVRSQVNAVGPDVTFTIRDGKRITLADQFAKAYGEAL